MANTYRRGGQEIGKEQVVVEERTPTMQGQRSKGSKESFFKKAGTQGKQNMRENRGHWQIMHQFSLFSKQRRD